MRAARSPQGNSLDVLEIDGASNNGVEQVRDLRDNVRYAPTRGKYKIYIIDEVHMLTSAAFNALLKTLEEPPAHVKFVFATTEPQKVLPTILSRCQRFDLRRIPAHLIAKHLQYIAKQEKIALDDAAANAIAKGAEGGLRDAESMLDQLVAFCGDKIAETDVLSIFGFTAQETVSTLCGHILEGASPQALAMVHDQAEAGKDLEPLDGRFDRAPARSARRESRSRRRDGRTRRGGARCAEIAGGTNPDGSLARTHRTICRRRNPHEMGSEQEAPFRDRGDQSNPDAWADDVERDHQHPCDTARRRRTGSRRACDAPSGNCASESQRAKTRCAKTRAARRITLETAPAIAPAPVVENIARDEPPKIAVVEDEKIWPSLLSVVRTQRPLMSPWLEAGTPLGIDGSLFLVGFPKDQSISMESIQRANNRKLLDELLTALAGRPLTIKCEIRNGLVVAPVVLPERKVEPPADPMEEFKNDPLIKKALEIFKAEIQPA